MLREFSPTRRRVHSFSREAIGFAAQLAMVAFPHLFYKLWLREHMEHLVCRILACTAASLQEIEKKALCFRYRLGCLSNPTHLFTPSSIIIDGSIL
jgi:hypothetical protein